MIFPWIILLQYGLNDLFLLQSTVLGLSVAYHIDYERPGSLAMMEGTSAKLLFLYGIGQLANCPSSELLAVEGVFASATLGLFLLTNIRKDLYEFAHPVGLHCIPGIWASLVACTHGPLVF